MSEIQAVVIGDNNVGKTSLCITFSTDQFPSLFTPMECNRVPHEKDLTVLGEAVHIKCVDTEGNEDSDDTRPQSYEGADVFLLCFSLSGPTSFSNVKSKWIPELKKYAPKVPILLVGCKEDLRKGHDAKNLVTKKQAQTLCRQIKAKGYVECGALKKLHVENCFVEAVKVATGRASVGGGCCEIL